MLPQLILGLFGLLTALLLGFGSLLLSNKGKKAGAVFNIMLILLAGNSTLNILTAAGG